MPPRNYKACPFCSQLFGSASLPIHAKRCKMRPAIVVDDLIERANSFDERPIVRPIVAPIVIDDRSNTISLVSSPASAASSTPFSPITDFRSDPMSPVCLPVDEDAANHGQALRACRHCSRTFAPDRLAVHERVCLAGRRSSTAKSAASSRSRALARRHWAPRPPSKWREQHEEFMAIARANRRHRSSLPTTHRNSAAAALYRHHLLLRQQQQQAHRLQPARATLSAGPSTFKDTDERLDGGKWVRSPTRRPNAAARHALEYHSACEEQQQQQQHRQQQHEFATPRQHFSPRQPPQQMSPQQQRQAAQTVQRQRDAIQVQAKALAQHHMQLLQQQQSQQQSQQRQLPSQRSPSLRETIASMPASVARPLGAGGGSVSMPSSPMLGSAAPRALGSAPKPSPQLSPQLSPPKTAQLPARAAFASPSHGPRTAAQPVMATVGGLRGGAAPLLRGDRQQALQASSSGCALEIIAPSRAKTAACMGSTLNFPRVGVR